MLTYLIKLSIKEPIISISRIIKGNLKSKYPPLMQYTNSSKSSYPTI